MRNVREVISIRQLRRWGVTACLFGAASGFAWGAEPVVHTLRFTGNAAFSDQDLAARLSLKPGQPFTEDQLVFSKSTLQSIYQDKGYWTVAISTDVKPAAPDRLDIHFLIKEGPLHYIGEIRVTGNRLIEEPVIRRELGIEPGQIFSPSKIYTGHRLLYVTGYFSSIDVVYSSAPAHRVNVLIHVVENPTRYIKGSAGYGAETKERLSIGYEDRNIFGKTRKLTLQAVHSGFLTNPNKYLTTQLQASLSIPHFFGSPINAQSDIAQEWQNHESYDTETISFRETLGRRFGRTLFANLNYRYEGTQMVNVSPELTSQPGFTNISALGPSFTYDNTNDPFLPFYGWRVRGAYEQGLEALIGDLAFYKWEARAGRFQTFFKQWTFFAGAQFGCIRPDDPGKEMPIFEKFTLGGASTVRGYTERDLGPKDLDGAPLGGDAYAVGNLEARHRIYKKLYGVAFLDGGQLWTRPVGSAWPDIVVHGLDDFRYGTGAGFRIHTPIGAIRLELGYQLNPETEAQRFFDRAAFHFSLGELF